MSREDRHNRLRWWLQQKGGVSRQRALRELEISASTLKRDIGYLRDRYGMPAQYRAELDAWILDPAEAAGGDVAQSVPGLWFTDREAHALLTMQQLLAQFDAAGLLRPHLGPLRKRLTAMVEAGGRDAGEVARRVRILPVGARSVQLAHFSIVSDATLGRRRLSVVYRSRSSGARGRRELSPQRLVHYRDNWYLDAWCHRTDKLKTFSLDGFDEVVVIDAQAVELTDEELDAELANGYGIFGGKVANVARLRFSAHSARWVSAERWHPAQIGRFDGAGRWLLDVPYSQPTELVMDILRHAPEVEVLAPKELELEVNGRLKEALRRAGGLDT